MTDTSSTYNDMWFSDTVVYLYGSTNGSVGVHQYRVALTLTTPSGTYLSSTPYYGYGQVSNSLSAVWTAADLNADFIGTSRHDYWCTISGVTPVLFYAQLRKRPPGPNYTCQNGTTNACSDAANGQIPLGQLKRRTCKQWNYCCDANNQYVSGWCREETCQKVGQQTVDPVVSQCMNEAACNLPQAAFCLGLP